MWCLVSQANSVILEVQVDPKAIGQECLEKVSHSIVVASFVCLSSRSLALDLVYVRPVSTKAVALVFSSRFSPNASPILSLYLGETF